VEGLFRFLKDKSFRVAEIFLKKNSRIQALAMIMVLCWFIYSMTEFRLRRVLARSGETVTSQTKKQTNRPTLKWIFFRFRRVREFSVVIGDRRMTKNDDKCQSSPKSVQLKSLTASFKDSFSSIKAIYSLTNRSLISRVREISRGDMRP